MSSQPSNAQTVTRSALQLDSSMHAPVGERTAGLSVNAVVASEANSLYNLGKSPEPNSRQPGHSLPKKYVTCTLAAVEFCADAADARARRAKTVFMGGTAGTRLSQDDGKKMR